MANLTRYAGGAAAGFGLRMLERVQQVGARNAPVAALGVAILPYVGVDRALGGGQTVRDLVEGAAHGAAAYLGIKLADSIQFRQTAGVAAYVPVPAPAVSVGGAYVI